jgi:hypothetical protein
MMKFVKALKPWGSVTTFLEASMLMVCVHKYHMCRPRKLFAFTKERKLYRQLNDLQVLRSHLLLNKGELFPSAGALM